MYLLAILNVVEQTQDVLYLQSANELLATSIVDRIDRLGAIRVV